MMNYDYPSNYCLHEFLIELGAGFCFEARQKRIGFVAMHSQAISKCTMQAGAMNCER